MDIYINFDFDENLASLSPDEFIQLILVEKLSIKNILDQYNPKQIIIDSSNSSYNAKKLKEEAKELGLNCWSILEDGAFVEELNL